MVGVLLEMILVGRNGAALAAFGEMVVLAGFSALLTLSPGERFGFEGVKLGLSTLKDFLVWLDFPVSFEVLE